MSDSKYPLITTQDALVAMVKNMADSPYIAVDTEFHREKTYFPQLCLIQLATDDYAAAVDPLTEGLDLTPLLELLLDKTQIKVFHAAKQDMEIFYNLTNHALTPVFDTQVAAMALGYGDQISYANLVQRLLSARLNKVHQLTDWTRRPLTPAQIAYAMDDVVYLRQIYKKITQQLESKKRTHWIEEEQTRLFGPEAMAHDPETLWQSVKCRDKGPRTVTALRELAKWRDMKARHFNRPRSFILKDDALAALAQQRPTSVEQAREIRLIPKEFGNRWGEEIFPLMAKVNTMPDKDLLRLPKPDDTQGVENVAYGFASLYMRFKAADLKVVPRLLASADDLDRFLRGERDMPLGRGWRYEALGKDLEDLMAGKIALQIENGRLRTVHTDEN